MFATLAASIAVAATSGPARAAEGDAGEQVRRILERGDYQTALPTDVDPVAIPVPGEFLLALLVVGLLVIVSFIVWVLARELGLGDDGRVRDDAAAVAAQEGPPEALVEESERLAAAGRFDEAVHLLLLAAIRRLSAESGREPRPSTTARELIATFPLRGERKDGFAALVRAVEWTLFGGRTIDADGYRSCRETFRTVVPG